LAGELAGARLRRRRRRGLGRGVAADRAARAGAAVIELREVVAIRGGAPVSARIRAGEVARLEGPPPACAALLEVIAGRRPPLAGEVRRDPRGAAVLVRAGERLPTGVDAGAAVAVWAALAGAPCGAGAVPGDRGVAAAARGAAHPAPLWLIDGALPATTEAMIQVAAEAARGGAGAMLWTAGPARGRVDQVIALTAAPAASPPPRRPAPRSAPRPTPWRAIGRFALAAAAAPSAFGLAALVAAWLAVAAWVVAAHQGYWTAAGSAAALAWVARLGAIGAAVIAATATAARARAAPAWPMMLRDAGAGPLARVATGLAADVGGVALTAAAAIVPTLWLARGPLALGAVLGASAARAAAVLGAAALAGAVERGRAPAGTGALVGVVAAVAIAAL